MMLLPLKRSNDDDDDINKYYDVMISIKLL